MRSIHFLVASYVSFHIQFYAGRFLIAFVVMLLYFHYLFDLISVFWHIIHILQPICGQQVPFSGWFHQHNIAIGGGCVCLVIDILGEEG